MKENKAVNVIAQYKEHQEKIKNLRGNIEVINDKFKQENNKIYDHYRELIHNLEEEKYDKINKLTDAKNLKVNKHQEQIKNLSEHIHKVERILKFIEVYRDEHPDNEIDLKVEGYSYYGDKTEPEIIEVIKKDYLCLKVVISPNRKPKNKYTLCLVGKHIFGDLLKLPNSYGLPLNTFRQDIAVNLKDDPEIQPLKDYYLKNKDKILNDLLAKYQEAEQEYKEMQLQCLTDEWHKLFLEWKMAYYEKHYSNGTEQPEYKKLQDELSRIGN